MAKDTQVRVSASTKAVINRVSALMQLETGASITADLAIRIAFERAFPNEAKKEGVDTDKEIQDRRSND